MSKIIPREYNQFFKEIKAEIQKKKYQALQTVSRELIDLYWEIGKRIVQKQEKSGWGKSIVKNLAKDLAVSFPDLTGFSEQNLWRMRQFHLEYRNHPNLSPLVRDLSWTNNLLILTSIKDHLEREFYLKMTIKERWSKRELERQIETDLFTRYMNVKNTSKTLPAKSKDQLAPFKDHYVLDFLGLNQTHSEIELRRAILANLRNFFLEFGKNFSFVGEEYPIRVGNDTYEIDLLFYHRDLNCLVPVELKIGHFKPEYLGKMQFYLGALDEKVKLPHENPSIGLILCKSKNNETVRIAFSQAVRKVGIATYQTKLLDTNLLTKKLHQISIPDKISKDKL